jgi:hypothetical protein
MNYRKTNKLKDTNGSSNYHLKGRIIAMKKQTWLFVSIFIGLLLATFTSISLASAQQDCTVFYGNTIPDNQIDGTIGSEWNDAGTYNMSLSPWGTANVWVKQDQTNLYIGLSFLADSENPWVAFQFGTSFCMSNSADGAVFGDDTYSPNGYQDIHFTEGAGVAADAVQNGVGAISVSASKMVNVELKKPLNSGDSDGKDINWTQGNIGTIIIDWDSNGGGSSGGTANHMDGTHTETTMLINSNPIPEFPSTIFILSLLVLTIPATIIGKKWRKRADQT